MASNGRLPASDLARIPGSGPYNGGPLLRKDAALAYNALYNYALVKFGVSMALKEGSVGRAYRSYSRQVLAKRIHGGNAAEPGTSNHGLGIAVDLMTRKQRWVIDQVGEKFGFSKRWSDASWEWWHIKFRPGRYPLVSEWRFPTLRHKDSGPSVERLQRKLRAKGYHRSVKANGYYGVSTRQAVWRFQKKHGLKADGVCGPATWRALSR